MESKYSFSKMSDSDERSLEDEDFDEEDVWGVVNHERKDATNSPKYKVSKETSSSSTPRFLPPAPKMVAKGNTSSNKFVHKSAPVNIPDWSKIHRNKSSNGASWGDVDDNGDVSVDSDHEENDDHGQDDEAGDGDDCEVPPHEWVAKKLARSHISSFSVCEGVGRTLKGRDLSKARNAILTKTGFLE